LYRRRVPRAFWFAFAAGAIVWLVLGIALNPDSVPINDLFDIATLAVFCAALLFIAIYTSAGFFGPKPRSKWWKNEVGTALVLAVGSLLFVVGPVAFAVLFNGGIINTWWWAWVWLGGHLLAACMLLMLVWLWIQNYRRSRSEV
jgi:hypothetical protein